MRAKHILSLNIAAVMAIGLIGCRTAGSSGKRTVVEGAAAIRVVAVQPRPPARPRPVVKPQPRPRPRKAKLVAKKIEISDKVLFETGKAAIRPESHGLLKDVADVLKKNPKVKKIRIEGHTDSVGSAGLNKKLSQQRASSVKKFLVGLGIDAGRLVAVGYGESKPIADNGTDEGKEKNRRVEFNIIEQ